MFVSDECSFLICNYFIFKAGQSALDGDYSKATLMVLLSRFKLPGLTKFADLATIANKLKGTKKGLQFEIVGTSVKDIFAELGKSGYKIVAKIGNVGVKLKNSVSGEEIMIRKSQSGNYDTFDTLSGYIGGVYTDIRVALRK